jgi:hypothetical protein
VSGADNRSARSSRLPCRQQKRSCLVPAAPRSAGASSQSARLPAWLPPHQVHSLTSRLVQKRPVRSRVEGFLGREIRNPVHCPHPSFGRRTGVPSSGMYIANSVPKLFFCISNRVPAKEMWNISKAVLDVLGSQRLRPWISCALRGS